MQNYSNSDVYIEDNDIISMPMSYRNFTGKPDKFHPNGTMGNFWIFLTESKAKELEMRGFNVRWRENRDGKNEARLQIFVRFEHVPPQIYTVTTGAAPVMIGEDDIEEMDTNEFTNVDLIINPYSYEVNGRTGVKAYLKKGYFKLMDDPYLAKYSVPLHVEA